MDDLHGITKEVGETKSEPSAVKRQYDLDLKINEVIDKLNRLDIRSPGEFRGIRYNLKRLPKRNGLRSR